MDKEELIALIRKHRETLSKEYGVSRIAVFGSIVTNRMKPDSDIDLLVEFSRPIGFRFNQLVEYIESILGKKIDLLTRDGLDNIRVKEVSQSIERSLLYV